MKFVLLVSMIMLLGNSFNATANKVKKLNLTAPQGYSKAPTVYVYSTKGEKWNKVDKVKATTFSVNLNADCKYEGKGNKAYRGNLSVSGFNQVGKELPADFLIPHAKSASAKFRYEGNSGFDAIKACNTELEKRLSQDADKTKYHVLAKGFTIKYPAALRVNYSLTCKPTGLGFSDYSSKSVKVNAKINCQGSDLAKQKIPKPQPIPARKATLVPLIKSVTFGPQIKNMVTTCPTQVKLNGNITATRPGTVKYQYLSHDKRKSPIFTLKFNKAGTKSLRPWLRTINKQQRDTKVTRYATAKPKYDYKGWYKLVILSPAGKKSVMASYNLKCVKKVPISKIK